MKTTFCKQSCFPSDEKPLLFITFFHEFFMNFFMNIRPSKIVFFFVFVTVFEFAFIYERFAKFFNFLESHGVLAEVSC